VPHLARADGGTIHLPDPDGSKDQESPAYEHFRELLIEAGLTPSWTPTYNAGANPITVRLTSTDLTKPAVQGLLRSSYRFVTERISWSDDQPADHAEPNASPITEAEAEAGGHQGILPGDHDDLRSGVGSMTKLISASRGRERHTYIYVGSDSRRPSTLTTRYDAAHRRCPVPARR
jgi:hypothetical protein